MSHLIKEDFSGFTRTLSFVPNRRDKKPYDVEKSKSKDKKKDYSKQRERKKQWE